MGIIGLGGRARWLAEYTLRSVPGLRVAAVCDILEPRVDSFVNDLAGDQTWNRYTNFLEMIERENLDGVMVETTTHTRAWVTVLAMQAGMDVYIEKPCADIRRGP